MRIILLTLLTLFLPLLGAAQQSIDIRGEWKVKIGVAYRPINLPGTLDDAGYGSANRLAPKLEKPQLTRLTRKHSFIGEAVYERDVYITREMAGKSLQLFLERVLWQSRLAVDGEEVGQKQESLVSPHIYYIRGGIFLFKRKWKLKVCRIFFN